MKVRLGFVSNSSSSSFYFCFGGDTLDDLFKAMRAHKKAFSVSASFWNSDDVFIDVHDVMRDLEGCKDFDPKNEPDYCGQSVYRHEIFNVIAELGKHLADNEKDFEKEAKKDEDNRWLLDSLKEAIKFNKSMLEKLNAAQASGLTSVVTAEFGDNHGITSNAGRAMDQEFEELIADDLVVLKENKH